MITSDIHDYLRPGRRAHLVGIGGVSMSPLAEVLHGAGMCISGSDMRESATVEHLRSLGITVAIGHRAENVAGAELVIRTAAVHDSNPEIAEARRLGIPVFERAQAWGSIMRSYRNALCISGTHGKTTTTSMCTHIAMAAGADPTVMIGGILPLLGAGHRVGKGDTIILESCEYCNSFLSFFPHRGCHSEHRGRPSGLLQGPGGRGALLPGLCRPGARERAGHRQPGRRQHHARPGRRGAPHAHLRCGGGRRPRRRPGVGQRPARL